MANSRAIFYVWEDSDPLIKRYQRLVADAHAGLDVEGICNHVYVTWLPSKGPIRKQFTGTPASRELGFAKLRHKRTGQVVPNTVNGQNCIHGYLLQQDPNLPRARGANGEPLTRLKPVDLEVETNVIQPEPGEGAKPPSIKVEISGQDILAGQIWGLRCDMICRWWFRLLELSPDDPRRQFRQLSTLSDLHSNCCSTVAKALYVGGLASYAKPPKNSVYQGYRTLRKWVQKANDRIRVLNQQSAALRQSREWNDASPFYSANQPLDFAGACELPTVEEWKQMSHVRASLRHGFARRHEQIAEIDRLLTAYHNARRHTEAADVALDFDEDIEVLFSRPDSWLNLMASIQEQCYLHLVTKPRSDRRMACLCLAKTIEYALRGNVRFHSEALHREAAGQGDLFERSIQASQGQLASLVSENPYEFEQAAVGQPQLSGTYEFQQSGESAFGFGQSASHNSIASESSFGESMSDVDSGSYAEPFEGQIYFPGGGTAPYDRVVGPGRSGTGVPPQPYSRTGGPGRFSQAPHSNQYSRLRGPGRFLKNRPPRS